MDQMEIDSNEPTTQATTPIVVSRKSHAAPPPNSISDDAISTISTISAGSVDPKADAELVQVANLIDFDSSDSNKTNASKLDKTIVAEGTAGRGGGGDVPSTPSDNTDSGISTASTNGRRSVDVMSESEEFEGIASGSLSGGLLSAYDSSPDVPQHHSQQANHFDRNRRAYHSLRVGSGRPNFRTRLTSPYSQSRHDSYNSTSEMELSVASDLDFAGPGVSELSNQMAQIKEQLASMQENKSPNADSQMMRLRQENAVLQERINMLEEQFQQTEGRYKERLSAESTRCKELLARCEREKSLESESVALKLQLLQRDHEMCESRIAKLASEFSTIHTEKQVLEEYIGKIESDLDHLSSVNRSQSSEIRRLETESDSELTYKDVVIDDLKREVEQLKAAMLETNNNTRRRGSTMSTSELELEVQRLRDEGRTLQEANEELHAQLLSDYVIEGRTLAQKGTSLADEMDSMSKDEVLQALHDQELTNRKLKSYIDGILLRIIEMHPAILEVGFDTGGA